MSGNELELYSPEYCDGQPCICDCSHCQIGHQILKDEEEE